VKPSAAAAPRNEPSAAQALAGDFPALVAARLAFGAGYGMVWTAGLCWLAGAMAGGPPALGGSIASAGVGGVVGPAVSGALAQSLASRSVLWTVSYPPAASGAASTRLGASVGLLNVIWAATAVLGPLGAGAAAEHLGASAAFGLTQAACAAALAVTAALTWRPARAAPDSSPTPRRGRIRSPSSRPS